MMKAIRSKFETRVEGALGSREQSPPSAVAPANSPRRAFTLLEIMLAIMIFSMVLTAIYAIWIAILRGKKSGEKAAAEVQRSRIAVRALEDAFLTAVMSIYAENGKYYYFIADSAGDMAGVSMVARLPASFPGVGRYGDQIVRRVSFSTQPGKDGGYDLVMAQAPMLLDTNTPSTAPYSLVLARDVSLFALDFWDMRKNEWVSDWLTTNQFPRLVRISLGLGKVRGKPQDLVTRIVAMPAFTMAGAQMPFGGMPPPGGLPPGVPPGTLPPGTPPGVYPGYQPGVPNTGFPNPGYPNQGYPNQGFPNQGFPNQGLPNNRFQQPGKR